MENASSQDDDGVQLPGVDPVEYVGSDDEPASHEDTPEEDFREYVVDPVPFFHSLEFYRVTIQLGTTAYSECNLHTTIVNDLNCLCSLHRIHLDKLCVHTCVISHGSLLIKTKATVPAIAPAKSGPRVVPALRPTYAVPKVVPAKFARPDFQIRLPSPKRARIDVSSIPLIHPRLTPQGKLGPRPPAQPPNPEVVAKYMGPRPPAQPPNPEVVARYKARSIPGGPIREALTSELPPWRDPSKNRFMKR